MQSCARRWLPLVAVLVGASTLPSISTAQETPSLPPGVQPGQIEKQFQAAPVPQSVPAVDVPAPDQAPPPDQAGTIRLKLLGVVIDGAQAVPEAELRPLYQHLLEREVTLLDLYKVRDAITAAYRNRGFVLSQAVIPAQRISAGIIRIEVIEGFINEVVFENKVADHLGLLDQMAAKIMAARPLTQAVLERYVLLINDLAGISARTVVKPAQATKGAAQLVVILDEKPVSAHATIDNRGSRAIGPFQGDVGVEQGNLLGLFERTGVRGVFATQLDELLYLNLSHSQAIDAEGTTVSVDARLTRSEPGFTVRPFEVRSLSTFVSLGVSLPLIRSRAETLRVGAEFAVRNSRTDLRGDLLSRDRLRVGSLGATYDFADDWQGSTVIDVRIHHGFDILGATKSGSDNLTRENGRSDFTKWTAYLQRSQPLSETLATVFSAQGQMTGDELLSSEEFGVGGKQFGSAFDSSELSGDQGFAVRLEGQYWAPLADWLGWSWLDQSQVYLFGDYGAVRNFEAGTRQGWDSLASAGLGLRLGIAERVAVNLEMAKPLNRDPGRTQSRETRGFFSISTRY